ARPEPARFERQGALVHFVQGREDQREGERAQRPQPVRHAAARREPPAALRLDDAPGARPQDGNGRQGRGEQIRHRQAPPARHHRFHQPVGGERRDEPHEARDHGGDPETHPDHRGYVVEQQQEEPERRRAGACSTAATRAKVTALSPKSETKLPKKHAPNGASPSALPSAVVSAIPPVVVQPNTKYEMGVEVSDAITPRPSPAGTAVLKLRNRPARAASPAYSATMIWTTTNGQKVGLRSVFTADVSTPTAMPTVDPASAVARIVPVVSRNSGRATASTAADSARLIATATGMSASSRTDTGQLP